MSTLGARLGFWLVLVLVGAGAAGWFMWGQVSDARSRAKTAEQQAADLGKRLEQIAARQAQTDASLAARRRQSDALTQQLSQFRSDLDRLTRDDPETSKWAADCVPSAAADRLRLPADPACTTR
jgi:uncharacterized protein HemX